MSKRKNLKSNDAIEHANTIGTSAANNAASAPDIAAQAPMVAGDGGVPPTVPPVTAVAAAPDPFDPAHLRLSQDFGASLGVKKLMTTVPVRKPAREWFIQTHPDPSYMIDTAVLELKEDRETYLVAPALWPTLATESTFSPRRLITTINTLGVVFIWPIRLPAPDGKIDEWSRSALEHSLTAQGKWSRIQANMSLGAYEITVAESNKPATWPQTKFQELLRIAFKGRYIDQLDHPVLRRLRGDI